MSPGFVPGAGHHHAEVSIPEPLRFVIGEADETWYLDVLAECLFYCGL